MVTLLALGIVQKPASAAPAINVNADAAILVEASTGKVLYEKNADVAHGIASMTKMMTEYLLLESVKEGKVKWDQKYSVPADISGMSHNTSLSNVPLRNGGQYTIKDLYHAMAIDSANAAAIAIGQTIGGTKENFVKMMNAKAKELGLKNYHFVNATGLNNRDYSGPGYNLPIVGGKEEENVMSAKDVATLAYRLVNDYPEVLETSSVPQMKFAEGTEDEFLMHNWIKMLDPNSKVYYEGLDGLKTGTTDFAGPCFTGTAKRNGVRFISVVMNVKHDPTVDSYTARFNATEKILNYAFSNFSIKEILPKNAALKNSKTLPVAKGKEKSVKIETNAPVKMVVQNGKDDQYKPKFVVDKKKLTDEDKLTAPVKKGEKVGYVTLESKDKNDLGYLPNAGKSSAQVSVVTKENVEKANWFVLSMRAIGGFFADIWHGVTSTVKSWF
ncbi:D-alanyl-D-alanine carboxypeptidase family protein [Falsibacillus albus]|uniref:serine-type D-Ala-D-Ala carboxypeptidase n=1 Tax=Falsibacillus albus TaxID=2478915 RepID=A0A3L7JHS9_9BACI|nr:D-alanyl-D-alanine carboxypeptidase [Falsibacillus albus]